LLAGLYALPAQDEHDLRGALDKGGEDRPWSASLAVAPEQTLQAVSTMLRQVMLATVDLNPASIRAEALEEAVAHVIIWRRCAICGRRMRSSFPPISPG
jgi:hypothetical protein